MHTAVTGESHCIPSNPSRDINFAWAWGPLPEFLSFPHFLPTTPPLFPHGRRAATQTRMCQPAWALRESRKSITQALADHPTAGHAVAQSCMSSCSSSLLWASICFLFIVSQCLFFSFHFFLFFLLFPFRLNSNHQNSRFLLWQNEKGNAKNNNK